MILIDKTKSEDDGLILTASDVRWIVREIDREFTTLELLLGDLSYEERKRLSVVVVERCLKTLRKGRGSC